MKKSVLMQSNEVERPSAFNWRTLNSKQCQSLYFWVFV